ncbi:hypothetical protein V8C86DRAFT_2926189 [Haematococcus lacustris]
MSAGQPEGRWCLSPAVAQPLSVSLLLTVGAEVGVASMLLLLTCRCCWRCCWWAWGRVLLACRGRGESDPASSTLPPHAPPAGGEVPIQAMAALPALLLAGVGVGVGAVGAAAACVAVAAS